LATTLVGRHFSGQIMKKTFLVIGASGYLGQQVMKQLGERAIATHRTAPSFADSLLDSARWWRMCNAQPLSIKDALQLEAN
jgi:uncharacterized protein YbjT (DUF2867 family)